MLRLYANCIQKRLETMDPDLTRLARAVELSRSIERLEQIAVQRTPLAERPFVVPASPAKASLESKLGSQYSEVT